MHAVREKETNSWNKKITFKLLYIYDTILQQLKTPDFSCFSTLTRLRANLITTLSRFGVIPPDTTLLLFGFAHGGREGH